MPNVQCPRCRQFSISLWDKMTTAPAGRIPCPKCHGQAFVSMSGWFAGLPAFAAAAIALWSVEPLWAKVAVVTLGAALSAFLNYKFVRLE